MFLPRSKTFGAFCLSLSLLQVESGRAEIQAAAPRAQIASSTTDSSPSRPVAGPGTASTVAARASAADVPLQPPPAGFNLQERKHQILAELSDVVRYFRLALTPVQKVGEPSDLLYREQALAQSTQIADLAFQSAKAESVLLAAYSRMAGQSAAPATAEGEAQKLQTIRANVALRLTQLKARETELEQALAKARPKERRGLADQHEQVEGALELTTAMADSLAKIASVSDTQDATGLAADIDRLQRSTPELAATRAKTVVPPPLENLDQDRAAGVATQASMMFRLLAARKSIDDWSQENSELRAQTVAYRQPLSDIVRSLAQQAQAVSQQVQADASGAPQTQPTAPVDPLAARKRADSLTATFKVVSAAIVPLSQEIIALEQAQANLLAWRGAVNQEYQEVLRSLLLRVLGIAIALGVLFLLGEIWRRATLRYVHDVRRRRQLLVLRRTVVGFATGLVLIFGFTTQFTSLATFAGFITAGLAVGLQTILLSVAAYFFIVGRYGVRVGDRISVAGVTGDVIDVGLVRFYMMELAGTGTDMQPTGRVAVFSNAVLFQAGTPLFKQLPGAEYAWHELALKLADKADFELVSQRVLARVNGVYQQYRPRIERQYQVVQTWMDAPIDMPVIDSRLQMIEGGLQLTIHYPVEIRSASEVDQQVIAATLSMLAEDTAVQQAVSGTPIVRAIVKG